MSILLTNSALLRPLQDRSATFAPATMAASAPVGRSFTDMMQDVAGGAVEKLKQAEATAAAGLTGEASVQQVVESVLAAEQTLQAAVAIRDKVVAAYLEIARMQI